MKETWGNIWSKLGEAKIVVPTNIGWTKLGVNVMGRGVAKQAAEYFPSMPVWYGHQCRHMKAETPVLNWESLLLFPVKPLNEKFPWLSWKNLADLSLIERSTRQLSVWQQPVVLPLVGCGNGKLRAEKVLPILHRYLGDNFTLIRVK